MQHTVYLELDIIVLGGLDVGIVFGENVVVLGLKLLVPPLQVV